MQPGDCKVKIEPFTILTDSSLQNHCEAQGCSHTSPLPRWAHHRIPNHTGDTFCKAIVQGYNPNAYITYLSEFSAWFIKSKDWVGKAFIETIVHYAITIKQVTAFTYRYRTCTKQIGSTNTLYHTKSSPRKRMIMFQKVTNMWPWSVSTEQQTPFSLDLNVMAIFCIESLLRQSYWLQWNCTNPNQPQLSNILPLTPLQSHLTKFALS